MKNKKNQTFVYEGLGFPITLIKAPLKKVFGEWVLDIDMTKLQLFVLRALAFKKTRLSKEELRFIRQYLFLTTTEFGRIFGVTHVAIVQWENGQRRISPSTELCLRLHILNYLKVKDKEFRSLYNAITLEQLSKGKNEGNEPLAINAANELKIA